MGEKKNLSKEIGILRKEIKYTEKNQVDILEIKIQLQQQQQRTLCSTSEWRDRKTIREVEYRTIDINLNKREKKITEKKITHLITKDLSFVSSEFQERRRGLGRKTIQKNNG